MSDLEVETELSGMTVPDLKKALKAKGLSVGGVKQDLIERLQLAMASDENDPNNDTDLLEDANDLLGDDDDEIVLEDQDSNPKIAAAPKKVSIKRDNTVAEATAATPAKIEAPIEDTKVEDKKPEKKPEKSFEDITIKKWTDEERAAKRAARFEASQNLSNLTEAVVSKDKDLTSDTKKQSRAERFGLSTKIGGAPSADIETLKKRADRFGQSSSSVMKKAEMDEKVKKRQERFGVLEEVEPSKKAKKSDVLADVGLNKTLKDEKLVKRAERFAGTTITA
jgi:SAP domain-containing ribonucleoprotein